MIAVRCCASNREKRKTTEMTLGQSTLEMRTISHLTPHYLWARSKELAYQRIYPDHPWLTREAVALLRQLLRKQDQALEFGSGRSTLWFARHVGHITSVDDSAEWHKRIKERVQSENLSNVKLLLHPKDKPEDQGLQAKYVRVVDQFSDHSLDFALVDGMYRDSCALAVLPKLKPGALLVIDNASWFLPSHSKSPNSRPINGTHYSDQWKQFSDMVGDWRRIWTYSGVTATVLFFKP
jgi:predicted O-methyltransferase YrrM